MVIRAVFRPRFLIGTGVDSSVSPCIFLVLSFMRQQTGVAQGAARWYLNGLSEVEDRLQLGQLSVVIGCRKRPRFPASCFPGASLESSLKPNLLKTLRSQLQWRFSLQSGMPFQDALARGRQRLGARVSGLVRPRACELFVKRWPDPL